MPDEYNSHSEHTVVFLVTPGDILDDRWLIEARIGQGAMGSVFRGHDKKAERNVAIKILAPEHCRKPKVLARFEREATLMTTLRHPNIIQLYGVGRRGALPYIVMQFLEGMTLADVLKRKGGRLSAGETLAVVKQISAGLSFIHHHGLVHRDIKPQNIFVGPGGRVTILDLGVVRDKSNPGLTRPGAMVGTPYYMSPEQIQGTDEIDKRTDVYALAAMTFELLVGRPPFLGNTNFEVLHAHRYQPVPDASQLSKSVNKDVARALATAMSKKREDRPLSASEFYADLEAFFGSTEKVDPAVAFAFLEEEAEIERQKSKDRAAKKATTRAATQQLKIQQASAPNPGKTDETQTERPRKSALLPTHKPGPPIPTPSAEVPMAHSEEFQLVEPPAAGNTPSKRHQALFPATPKEPREGEPSAGMPSKRQLAPFAKEPEPGKPSAGLPSKKQQAPFPKEAESGGLQSRRHPAPRIPTEPDLPETGEPFDTMAGTENPSAATGDAGETQGGNETDFGEQRVSDRDTADEERQSELQSDPNATVTETGELRIVTTMKGLTATATLFVDGRPEGNTPKSVQIPVGKHVVRVERAGSRAVEKQAVVTANQVSLVRIELGPVSK